MKLTKAVNSNELERLTRDGWQVVDRVDHAQRVEKNRLLIEDAHEERDPTGYSRYVQAKYSERADLIVDPLFVLEKDAEAASVEQALRLELDGVLHQLSDAEAKARVLDERNDNQAKRIASLETSNESQKTTLTAALKGNAELTAEMTQLKADLAKVRKEVGESRWRVLVQEMDFQDGK